MTGYNATLWFLNNDTVTLMFNVTDRDEAGNEVLIACNSTVTISSPSLQSQLVSICNLSFPSPYTVTVNHTIKVSIQNASAVANINYPAIYFESGTYNSSILFRGAPTPIPQVPEFPFWLIPVALTLLAVPAYFYANSRRKPKTPNILFTIRGF
jgi:hypothetical protein